jgi:hypothetical protein
MLPVSCFLSSTVVLWYPSFSFCSCGSLFLNYIGGVLGLVELYTLVTWIFVGPWYLLALNSGLGKKFPNHGKRCFHIKFVYNLTWFCFVFRYVVVENLRYMLSDYNSSEPTYFGCRFKPYVKQGYMSGGAGK